MAIESQNAIELLSSFEFTPAVFSKPRDRPSQSSVANLVSIKANEDEISHNPNSAEGEVIWTYITGMKLFVVISTVSVASFIMLLDGSIIVTATPSITTEFQSLEDVGWYGSAYLLANCSFQPLTGKLYTRFSSKLLFLSFLALFELGSLLCGMSKSSNMLIIGRAVAGLGGSGITNGGLTIITNCVPLEKRASYLGIMISIAQLGMLFGPLLGGVLTQYTTWRWCFYINLPVGACVALFLALITIPDRRAKINPSLKVTLQSLDLLGFGLFAPAATMLLLALEFGGSRYPWNSSIIVGLFCGAGANFLVFLAWEYSRGETAMIPFHLVRQRIIWASCAAMFFLSANQLLTSYYLSMYFQAIKDLSPVLSGISFLPSILSQMFMGIVSGALTGRFGYYLPWIIFSGAMATISSGLISTYDATTATAIWIIYQAMGGIGRGCGFQMPIIAVQNHLAITGRAAENSVGMSLIVFSQNFGGAMFLSFAQATFDTGLSQALSIYAPGISPATIISGGARGFRDAVLAASVDGVVQAYNEAISHVFYLTTGTASGIFLASWFMGWRKIEEEKKGKAK